MKLKLFLQNLKKHKKLIRNIFLIALGIAILGVIGVELFLRFHYGLCDAVLMRADEDYEYIAQPNQSRKRLGNTVLYNSYSMRSDELHDSSLRVVCVGDSILNGGTFTDQSQLATTLLSQKMSHCLQKDIQVLNISAGSWGPDNCAAYLKKHGHFDAKAIILVTSSHDARDTMTFVPVVGRLKNFPQKQYSLAIIELLDRYLNVDISFFHKTKDEVDSDFRKKHNIEQASDKFNPGFAALLDYTRKNNIPFCIYLHADLQEVKKRKYDVLGEEIISFATKNGVPIFGDLDYDIDETWFVDGIHYSAIGQQKMCKILFPVLKKILTEKQ